MLCEHTSTYKCYGVENAGNTCTFSVLLQEFSCFPDYYEPLLRSADIRLKAVFTSCIETLKHRTVQRNTIHLLAHLYFKLVPFDDTFSTLQIFLNNYFPNFIDLPAISPYKLYESFLSFFPEVSLTSHKIVWLSKEPSETVQDVIRTSQSIHDITSRILWRIAIDKNEQISVEEHFEINKRSFSLKLALCCLERSKQFHVVAYHKKKDYWVLCDDEKISVETQIPRQRIYTLIYDSELSY
jgi:hypothetical protein